MPPYYLVYFLLVDLLQFPHMGEWEKTAWTVPVRLDGRLYGIEHRKMGLGIFAPSQEVGARRSGKPTDENEADARRIRKLISNAVDVASPYFEWRAEQAASGNAVNVVNRSEELLGRFMYFRDRHAQLLAAAEKGKAEKADHLARIRDGTLTLPMIYRMAHEADWNAQAAVEAFFSWTEHAFIHIAILLGRLATGHEVGSLAEADWKAKYKAVFDLSDAKSKRFYDELLDLRAQIRNFMAHGAFGKRGEAFHFHSGAGAVPVLLTHRLRSRYTLTGKGPFNERTALVTIENFFEHLWSGPRAPARLYLESDMPSIVSFVGDGTYANAMTSDERMEALVNRLVAEHDRAANMDW